MESASELLWFFKVIAIFIVLIMHYVYFYFLHKIYGANLYGIRKLQRSLSFKTNKSLYQIDKKHQKLMYKSKKDQYWKSVNFQEISDIYVEKNTGTASIIEFFFGDFGLFDFFRDYRDRLHTYDIKLGVVSGHQDMNMDVTILSLKQYEQREFFLGQLLHDLDIWIMRKLGFYTSIDEIYEEKSNDLVALFHSYGLELNYKRDKRYK